MIQDKEITFENLVKNLPDHIKEKLEELKDFRERKDFHPEESCFKHIEIVTNRAIEFGDINLIMVGIFHDIHKLDCYKNNLKKFNKKMSFGHDKAAKNTVLGDESVRRFISDFNGDPDTVGEICGEHMRIHKLGVMRRIKQDRLMNLPFFPKLIAFSVFDDMLLSDEESLKKAKMLFDLAVKFQDDAISDEEIKFLRMSGKMVNKKRNEK